MVVVVVEVVGMVLKVVVVEVVISVAAALRLLSQAVFWLRHLDPFPLTDSVCQDSSLPRQRQEEEEEEEEEERRR